MECEKHYIINKANREKQGKASTEYPYPVEANGQ